jgi:hypothetical protein
VQIEPDFGGEKFKLITTERDMEMEELKNEKDSEIRDLQIKLKLIKRPRRTAIVLTQTNIYIYIYIYTCMAVLHTDSVQFTKVREELMRLRKEIAENDELIMGYESELHSHRAGQERYAGKV